MWRYVQTLFWHLFVLQPIELQIIGSAFGTKIEDDAASSDNGSSLEQNSLSRVRTFYGQRPNWEAEVSKRMRRFCVISWDKSFNKAFCDKTPALDGGKQVQSCVSCDSAALIFEPDLNHDLGRDHDCECDCRDIHDSILQAG